MAQPRTLAGGIRLLKIFSTYWKNPNGTLIPTQSINKGINFLSIGVELTISPHPSVGTNRWANCLGLWHLSLSRTGMVLV